MATRKRTGFTFIELLVAMALLGLLSAIAVPRYRGFKERSYAAAMKSDLGHLRIALEEYWAENQRYTTDTTELDFHATTGVQINITSQDVNAGYKAIATHLLLPGEQCYVAAGPDALGTESGAVICGAAALGGPVPAKTTP
ncbi:MAG TPA: prepilin-type N-terminal cleavage/methylation domain-containing protein [Gemmatimonadaceae bacterium]